MPSRPAAPDPSPARCAAVPSPRHRYRLLGLLGRALRLLFRALGPALVAVLIAFARALGGPRYEPPHLPQNQPTEVEKKR